MDHLEHPDPGLRSKDRIPYVCDNCEDYDGLDFMEFPVRKVWSRNVGDEDWLQCPDEALATRVQLWLYFGLLSSFCGQIVPNILFLEKDDCEGFKRLSTKGLSQVLARRKSFSLEKSRTLLFEAWQLVNLLESKLQPGQETLLKISFSISVLIETLNRTQGIRLDRLTAANRYLVGRRWPFVFSRAINPDLKTPAGKAVQYKMLDAGWCPAQVTDFCQRFDGGVTLRFLSKLPLNNKYDHSKCTTRRCVAYNIDETSYETKHRFDCAFSSCSVRQFPSSKVAEMIENNDDIPLVSCSLDESGSLHIDLTKAAQNIPYTAISHVWSGGLGNPLRNGLPECQLRYLIGRIALTRGKAYNRETTVHFWMDTLCVPVDQDFKAARHKAIRSMAMIYSRAASVLVIDAQLQSIAVHDLDPRQIIAYLLCSPWMTRCWTLQEASLSNKWLIDFQDKTINVLKTVRHIEKKAVTKFILSKGNLVSSMNRSLVQDLSRCIYEMTEVQYQRQGRYSRSEIWNLKQLEEFQAHFFALTWNNFVGRTTSKAEDLHHILASLEDIRPQSIQALDAPNRMKAILKCHAFLPTDLLFLPCERMQNAGPRNAWAPIAPQVRRLDESIGTMKVFLDCLFIRNDQASEHLKIFVAPRPSSNDFTVDLQDMGLFKIISSSSKPLALADTTGDTVCLMLPSSKHTKDASINKGALFTLRSQSKKDICLTFQDTFQISKTGKESKALLATALRPTPRVFVDCGK